METNDIKEFHLFIGIGGGTAWRVDNDHRPLVTGQMSGNGQIK